MKAAQRLVCQIKTIIEVGRPTGDMDASSLAAEYAQRCSETNERLRLCKRYLSRGMLSEAMHVAEEKPVLLDLCAVLDFLGVEEWDAICSRSNWSMSEHIDADCVAMLNEHYGSAMALEPAIKRYRKAVREKDTALCIGLLREIIRIDPGNKNWPQDLQAFEKKRHSEIRDACDSAVQNNDSATLGTILQELNEEWLVQPDSSLLETVERGHRTVREKEATADGRRIVSKMSEAYSALGFDEVQNHMREYQSLLRDGFFFPDENMALQFEEARDWFLAEEARRQEDQGFEAALAALKTELDREQPTSELERAWAKLASYNRDVDENLVLRAHAGIETFSTLAFRKKQRLVVATVLASLIVVCGVLSFVWHIQYRREEGHWCALLEESFDAYDLAGFKRTAQEIPAYRPALFGKRLAASESVQEWTRRVGELAERVQTRTTKFDEIAAVLNVVREQGLEETPERVDELVDKADEIAFTEPQRALVKQFRQEWLTHNDNTIEALIRDIYPRMPTLADFHTNSLADVAAVVASLRDTLNRSSAVKGASPATYQRIVPYENEVCDLEKAVSLRTPLHEAVTGAKTPARYVEALNEYAAEFPDDRLSQAVAEVVRIGPSAYRDCLDVWEQQKQNVRNQTSGIQKRWPAVREAVTSLGTEDLLVNLQGYEHKSTASKEQQLGFLKGTFSETVGTIRNYQSVGPVYFPVYRNRVPSFRDCRVPRSATKAVIPLLHCALLAAILERVDDVSAPHSLDFMLSAVAEFAKAPVWDQKTNRDLEHSLLNSFLKVKLLRFFSEQSVALAGPGVLPELEMALSELRTADERSIDWLCIRNPKMAAINRSCASVLDQHFTDLDWISQERFRGLGERCAITRGIQWTGCVDLDNPRRVQWRGRRPKEAWAFRVLASDRLSPCIALLDAGKGKFKICTPLLPGEPLFSPTDDSTTAEILEAFLNETGVDDTAAVRASLPPNWPVFQKDGDTVD